MPPESAGRSKKGSCDRSAYAVDTTIVYTTNAAKAQLVLKADGQYNGWGERNAFVDAIVAAASEGEKCEMQQWSHGGPMGTGVKIGSENQCTQTNFISVNRFDSNNNLKGFMSVHISQAEVGSGWCDEATGVLGAIATFIGAIPGLGGPSAAGAGFFGLVNALCQ